MDREQALEQMLELNKKELENLEKKYLSLEEIFDRVYEKYSNLEGERDDLVDQVEDLKSKLYEAEANYSDEQDEVDAQDCRIEKLEKSIYSAMGKINRIYKMFVKKETVGFQPDDLKILWYMFQDMQDEVSADFNELVG